MGRGLPRLRLVFGFEFFDHVIKAGPEQKFELPSDHCGIRTDAKGVLLFAHGVQNGAGQSFGGVIALFHRQPFGLWLWDKFG